MKECMMCDSDTALRPDEWDEVKDRLLSLLQGPHGVRQFLAGDTDLVVQRVSVPTQQPIQKPIGEADRGGLWWAIP